MVRVSNIKIGLERAKNPRDEHNALKDAIIFRLKIKESELVGFRIFKKSVDARKKNEIFYIYTLDVNLSNEKKVLERFRNIKNNEISLTPDMSYKWVNRGSERLKYRPVIIGMGPAGLFAGLFLSRQGYNPIVLERGEDVDNRAAKINRFWNEGSLDPESNVQFGEGGAGTFSDGKLTTLINDARCRVVLEEFVKAGAPEDILYKAKPHIGTDRLRTVVRNMRQEIIANGGEVRFNSKVTDFLIKNGRIEKIIINGNEELPCEVVLLATGHSARDTYEVLFNRGVNISAKPFSIGVRIEHPQEIIDKAQYGNYAGFPGLGAADYKLSYHSKSGRSCYTFCMCPGGFVVAAESEENGVVTNGMSEYKRDGENANSAVLVGISPDDFESSHPLAGINFQRIWERKAFEAGGRNYRAPVQLIGDFLNDRISTDFGKVLPTYKPGTTFAMIRDCLPFYVTDTIKEALLYFDSKIRGFAMPDGILTGVETRSFAPVRINRDNNHLSNIEGLYPVGEGAGYAGGIMSSAVDGIKTAEKVMERFSPLS